MQGPSIVVGIDYGTTYSGIAYCVGGSVEDIQVLSKWPGGGNRTSLKVPSDISYEGGRLSKWGYQVRQFTEAYRGIKLLLDVSQRVKYTPSTESKALLKENGIPVRHAVRDYLKQLIEYTKQVLQRQIAIDAAQMNLQFVLTVPAVWSEKAKQMTLEAAVAAGADFKIISLVSEPEAAALYTPRAIQPNTLATNDVFIVCDAGGGTVDLISYQIKSLEPLCLAEVTKGTGDILGSVVLDCRFDALLRKRMGEKAYEALSRKSKETTMTFWQERVKPNFMGDYDEDFGEVEHFIPVAGAADDPGVPIEDGFFVLSNDDIKGIFEPVTNDIEMLIDEQMFAVEEKGFSAETIILVGGFGASEYLFNRLNQSNTGVPILQPPNGYEASNLNDRNPLTQECSGAVHRGLEGNKVESRIARRHYGTQVTVRHDPAIHSENDPCKYRDPLEEIYKVDERMKWFVRKSSVLSENKPIRLEFSRNVKVKHPEHLIFRSSLLFCNEDDAPEVFNTRVMHLCQLKADLCQIPVKLFELKKNSQGVEYWKIPFIITMTSTSASLIFELEFNGVSYRSARSKY
ncbi:hypothetical protein ASPSYDRAFT_1160155 [Aspergillus sydowii CBS 593.65]|uniref:Actin-like ATPase domain-containing protein n=1 Tax=Aspergillus sydowii CBS 593.65 TaxID=1036612 RepID=A0A1L9T6D5_9EURO|nr:uncharacterized protein ASPSYDRAFT_1160155 [Aspergillus sydowii CBS 593.65]OJJ54986.1 hypothetical protein ASPSYDRAFT_1160155 [Aspergillus sydowii CBS 593.65]